MAYTRFNGTVEPFAKNATGSNRTVFGDTVKSDNITTNLNAKFKLGWEIVGINDNPTKQDFNALAYTISHLVAYLHQQGIAEYNVGQQYVTGSYVVCSDGELYRSLTGNATAANVGNNPLVDTVNWKRVSNRMDGYKHSDFAKLNTSNTFTTKQRINGYQVDNLTLSRPDGTSYNGIDFKTGNVTNFLFYQENNVKGNLNIQSRLDDGTVAGTAMSVERDTAIVDFPSGMTSKGKDISSIGVDQSWRDVTSTRITGDSYMNTTHRPIMVIISFKNGDGSSEIKLYVDNFLVSRGNGYSTAEQTLEAIIPAGSEYKYENVGSTPVVRVTELS